MRTRELLCDAESGVLRVLRVQVHKLRGNHIARQYEREVLERAFETQDILEIIISQDATVVDSGARFERKESGVSYQKGTIVTIVTIGDALIRGSVHKRRQCILDFSDDSGRHRRLLKKRSHALADLYVIREIVRTTRPAS